jgi:hypothetical protein
MVNSINIIKNAVMVDEIAKISRLRYTDLIIGAFDNILSDDIDVLLVNMLYITRLRIRKIGKYSMLFTKIVLNTKFSIDKINKGSKNDHAIPKIEFLYLSFKSITAKVKINDLKLRISVISSFIKFVPVN